MTDRLMTPSKITAWLDCAHYLTLRSQVDSGAIEEPRSTFGSFAQLLVDKGLAHEQQCLADYRQQGKSILEVPDRGEGETFAAWVTRVGNPLDGEWDVVYQMPFVHDGLRGIADFLLRVVDPDTGAVSYEPVDAKLARAQAKPGHVLQLCFYADAIEALTGVRPERMHLWLGSGRLETLRVNDFSPYWRRLRSQLSQSLAAGPAADTVPRPCSHCEFCEFQPICDQRWRAEGALSLVAGIRQPDVTTLEGAGVATLTKLAGLQDPVDGLRPQRQQRLVGQAALQVQALSQPEAAPPFEMIPAGEDPVWGRGFEGLPRPDKGDVFLDFEGHPFWRADGGLFFLLGLLERGADGQWGYRTWWAHDLAQEAVAVAGLVDYLVGRREQFPNMHVYHYNHTERSSLQALTETHDVAQNELADLVETGLFVDLLLVARNSIQVGTESYGLKALERLTDFQRGHDIDQGAGAVLQYERYMADGEPAGLEAIAVYNEDDVRATRALRDWLVEHRPAEVEWRQSRLEPDPDLPEVDEHVAALHGVGPGTAEYFLGDVLGYWRRERLAYLGPKRAELQGDSTGLLDDPDVLTGLQDGRQVERLGKRGKPITPAMRFSFPPQELDGFPQRGGKVMFVGADDQLCYTTIDQLDRKAGLLRLVWNEALQDADVQPSTVVVDDWVSPRPKPQTLSAFAARLLNGGDVNPATMALLRRDLPQFADGGGPAGGVFSDDLAEMTRWVVNLDNACVGVQGPPGAGKTHSAAHLIHALVMAGRRVGITAMTHLAIDNVLAKVLEVFAEKGDTTSLRAVRNAGGSSERPLAPDVAYGDNKLCARAQFNVVAGTPWAFASDQMQGAPVDVLLIDEAGQLALADALAASCSARNLILLGDPLQLPQVAQAVHPASSGRSVLEHILGDEATMPADRGVFLSTTYRMHPGVCTFISDEIYQGRLGSHPDCEKQSTTAGTGLRWIRAEHHGNSTSSAQEADLIAAEIGRLLGTSWTNMKGDEAPLGADDFMVVAPYNDQVHAIRERLASDPLTAGVPVGTVDKFQGREAAVVFFSMATSSGEDMPRGAEFLFSRNRLNVAISRARCLAYLVCTDELLNTRARTVEDMRLIGTLNAVVEYADHR